LELLSVLSITTNVAIIYYTSKSLNESFPDLTDLEKFGYCVLLEHIILGVKMFLSIIIQDVPGWVFRRRMKDDDRLEGVMSKIEQKAEDFKANGGVLFKDTIKELKQENKKLVEEQLQNEELKANEITQEGGDDNKDEDDAEGKVFKKAEKKKKITVSSI